MIPDYSTTEAKHLTYPNYFKLDFYHDQDECNIL